MLASRESNVTFVVRISCHADGGVSGVIERVKTGSKRRFEGCDGLGALVARMLADARAESTTQEGQIHG